jgi:hypothetical protein
MRNTIPVFFWLIVVSPLTGHAQENISGDSRGTEVGGAGQASATQGAAHLSHEEVDPFVKSMEAAGLRPFDDTDVEMQSLMIDLQTGGGCPQGPHDGCPEVRQRFVGGGDRLAEYLIRQLELSEREGLPGSSLYLQYIAYTESETSFDYLVSRLRKRQSLSEAETGQTIMALGRIGDTRVIEEVIPVFDESTSFDVRADVVRAVVRTMERSGTRPSHAVSWLRGLANQSEYQHYVTRKLKSLGIE